MGEPNLQIIQLEFPEYKNQEDMLNQIAEFLKSGAENCRESFKNPEDDWMPMYLVVFDAGPARLITSTLDKHALVNLIAQAAGGCGAVGIGQLNSSWRLMWEKENGMPKGPISKEPGQEEGLMMALYARTDWRVEWSPIKRHKSKPPLLGPWEVMMRRKEGAEVGGLMFEPLFKALRKN